MMMTRSADCQVGILAVLVLGCCLTACTPNFSLNPGKLEWAKNGTLTVAAPAPKIGAPEASAVPGFVPSRDGLEGNWLSINRASGSLKLMHGNQPVILALASSAASLKPGVYTVLHKQKEPVWHAPDTYFRTRNLPIPPEGDRARFRRGALGNYAIYLDKDTPIHCGPVSCREIGGARVPEPELAEIYAKVDVGSVVQVE